jgi:hypothetical protein
MSSIISAVRFWEKSIPATDTIRPSVIFPAAVCLFRSLVLRAPLVWHSSW